MRIFSFLAKTIITVSLLIVIARQVDLAAVFAQLTNAELRYLIPAIAIHFLLVVPQSQRWRMILRVLGHNITFARSTSLVLIGWFFSQALPSSVGGDALRVYYLRHQHVSMSHSFASVVLDRGVALIALSILILLSLPLARNVIPNDMLLAALGIAAPGTLLAVLFLGYAEKIFGRLLNNRLRQRLAFIISLLRAVLLTVRPGAVLTALSMLVHAGMVVVAYLLASSLNIELAFLESFVVFPVIILATVIPLSIAGWGVRESAAVYLLTYVGVDMVNALALSILLGLVTLLAALPGGLAWLSYRREVTDPDQPGIPGYFAKES